MDNQILVVENINPSNNQGFSFARLASALFVSFALTGFIFSDFFGDWLFSGMNLLSKIIFPFLVILLVGFEVGLIFKNKIFRYGLLVAAVNCLVFFFLSSRAGSIDNFVRIDWFRSPILPALFVLAFLFGNLIAVVFYKASKKFKILIGFVLNLLCVFILLCSVLQYFRVGLSAEISLVGDKTVFHFGDEITLKVESGNHSFVPYFDLPCGSALYSEEATKYAEMAVFPECGVNYLPFERHEYEWSFVLVSSDKFECDGGGGHLIEDCYPRSNELVFAKGANTLRYSTASGVESNGIEIVVE